MNVPTTPSLAITWQQPTFLLPLFCLCSLLAASNSLATAIGLSGVICIATFSMALLTSLFNRFLTTEASTLVWLLLCSAVIAVLELLVHATFYQLFRTLGMFLPLTLIACLLISRAEMQAEQDSLLCALRRALQMSSGFLLAAVIVGAAREMVGHGSLFYDAGALLGPAWQSLSITLFRADRGFLLAVLAPGAFIGFGIGVALYNWLWLHFPKRNQ